MTSSGVDQAPLISAWFFLRIVPLPSPAFFHFSGSLHFRLSGRVLFDLGSLRLISLFLLLPTAEKAEVPRLAGLEPRTYFSSVV